MFCFRYYFCSAVMRFKAAEEAVAVEVTAVVVVVSLLVSFDENISFPTGK